jgi:hypothetical protein
VLAGELGHGVGVKLDVFVVLLAVGDVGVLEVFVRDRREQDQTGCFRAVVLGGRRRLDEVFQVFLELGEAGRPGK